MLSGIDFNAGRTLVTSCHTDEVIAQTLAGAITAVQVLRPPGLA